MKRSIVALILFAACLTGCPRSNISLPDVLHRADIYGRTSATQLPASALFCGHDPKSGRCDSNVSIGDSGVKRPAFEHVEVRGQIVAGPANEPVPQFDDSGSNHEGVNEEFNFNVLLFTGWDVISEEVMPINTPAALNSRITPYNMIQFGCCGGVDSSSLLTPDGHAWGGAGAAVIHVEMDGVFPGGTPSDVRYHLPFSQGDWTEVDQPDNHGQPRRLFWPIDPRDPPDVTPNRGPLKVGDYVRIVGTLWEDGPHIGGAPERGGAFGDQAKRCWNDDFTAGRGWFEIHPVDFLARIDPPQAPHDTVEVISICGETELHRSITPPGPKPSPTSMAGVEEIIDRDFTNDASEAVHQSVPSGDQVTLDLRIAAPGPKFKALYRVFWR
jgi:hypothetical protein